MSSLPDIPVGSHRSYECSWSRIGDSDEWLLECPLVDEEYESTWFHGRTMQTRFVIDGVDCDANEFLERMGELRGFQRLDVLTPGVVALIEYSTASSG